MVHTSPLSLIGNTPLLQLTRLVPESAANLYAKLETTNLTGSVKDRAALGMIEAAEREGRLKPGDTIIESTSGNLGVALAAIAAQKGYKLLCVIDPVSDLAKVGAMKALGAQTYTVTTLDADGSFATTRRKTVQQLLQEMPEAVNLNQYRNPANPQKHHDTTGPEIYEALDGKIDVLVAAAGTCGTLCGVARFLKEQDPAIRIVGVEPESSVLFGGTYKRYLIRGSGMSFVPDNYDPTLIDEKVKIKDIDAFVMARTMATKESVLVGSSAGSALHIAVQEAIKAGPGKNVVAICPDNGMRYLDSIFNDDWWREHDLPLPDTQA
jgi:2,3-diaminopropionate biosynthesis protein SbnA